MMNTHPQEIKLALTPHELDIAMNAIVERPYKEVFGVVNKIMTQANNQNEPKPGDPDHPGPPEQPVDPAPLVAHHPV
jgi:hypothetical protein